MKPVLASLAIIVGFSICPAQDTRQQKVQAIADLNTKIKILEQELLEPSADDIRAAASRGMQAVRILPRGKFEERTFDRGGGAYYSFATGSHSYDRIPQIEFQQKNFSVGFAGADYGFIADLGERELAAESPELTYLASYKVPIFEKEIREEQRASHDRKVDGLTFTRRVPAAQGHSYILRAISFREADTLVGFEVLRFDNDGSVIIAFKKLADFPVPKLFLVTDSDLKASVSKIIADLGVLKDMEFEVKENVLIVQDRPDSKEWKQFQQACERAGLRFESVKINEATPPRKS